MNLYLISQQPNNNFDKYTSAVVAAISEDEARRISPDGKPWKDNMSTWCATIDQVLVELIGTALPGTEAGVILASYEAG